MPLTKSVTVLSSGIDSLYVSYRGDLRPELGEKLERLKARARDDGHGQLLELSGTRSGVVQPSGWGRFRYWIRGDGFDVFTGWGAALPVAYVRLKSMLIHEVGPHRAILQVGSFINGLLLDDAGDAVCSRVDIYCDFQGWVPRSTDYERFVVRSRKNTWHTAVHHDGRSFTGFTFGRDAVVARLYDKTVEIRHSGKDWMRDVWGDRLDPSEPVWRLEFQLRRPVLRECGLSDPNGVIECRDRLWRYGTEWLSLRKPRSSARRVRWPVADVWTELARSKVDTPGTPLVRTRIRNYEERVLVRGLAGYASSLAAINGVSDLDVTMAVSRRRLAEYLDAKGQDFRQMVRAKRGRRLSR